MRSPGAFSRPVAGSGGRERRPHSGHKEKLPLEAASSHPRSGYNRPGPSHVASNPRKCSVWTLGAGGCHKRLFPPSSAVIQVPHHGLGVCQGRRAQPRIHSDSDAMNIPPNSCPVVGSALSMTVNMKALVTQSCPTLCDPVDCSPPGCSVHGILQASILEWVAISFSRGYSRLRD